MNTYSNLPPGCRVSDLPGNSRYDDWYEDVWINIDDDVLEAMDESDHICNRMKGIIDRYDPEYDPEYVAQTVSEKYHELFGEE